MRNKRSWMGFSALAGLLVLSAGAALAAAPLSDDFSGATPASFWTFEQIGMVGGLGAVMTANKTLTMTAGGADVWGTADAFSYLFQPVTGDFQVTVHMDSGLAAPADPNSKAGLMVRASDSPGAAYVFLFESPRRAGVFWEGRTANGIASTLSEQKSKAQPPIWLRISRLAGVLTPYISTDGFTWTAVGTPQTVKAFPGLNPTPDGVLVGIAENAHTTNPANLPSSAVFSNFAVSPQGKTTVPSAVTDLAASNATANSVDLTFTAPDDGAKGTVAGYDIREALLPITAANFANATPVAGALPAPAAPGTAQKMTVTGLGPVENYYFAVRARDGNFPTPNWGGISNVPQAQTIFVPFPTLPKVTDKAVYWDAKYATNWIDAKAAKQINDYFVALGYTSVNAAALGAFMSAHATSGTPSVVVMSNDIYPDTVIDITHKPLDNKNILNNYLNNGGRIVQYGDWPFYNIALTKPAGGELSPNPAGNGGPEILGFNVSAGTTDTMDKTVLTPVASVGLGLTSTWTSQRPTTANLVDVVLSTSKGGANSWVKFYPGPTGPGFFGRLYDTTSGAQKNDLMTADQLADGQKLAEVNGPISFSQGRLLGQVVDGSGNPASGVPVTITGKSGYTATLTTDSSGVYTALLLPDTYTVTGADPASFVYGAAQMANASGGNQVIVPNLVASVPPFYETTTAGQQSDDFAGTKLDPKWTDLDINDATGGSAVPNNGELDATAGGSDIWNNADGFHYTFQPAPSGNFAATVEVLAVPDVNDWTKAGVMARVTSDKASADAFTGFTPRHDGQNEVRPTAGAATTGNSMTGFMAAGLPTWIKIRRVNDKVASYWTTAADPTKGPVNFGGTVQVPDFSGLTNLLIGIAETSHNASDTDKGFKFAHFRVESLSSVPFIPGPALGDPLGAGKVTLGDATYVLEVAVKLKTPSPAQFIASDVNKDGVIDTKDVLMILKAIVNGTGF